MNQISGLLAPTGRAAPGLRGLDELALALLALLALGGLLHPFDAGWLLSGDALYPIQLLQTPWLAYRPPAPNRLFPDVAVHAGVALLTGDPLTQKVVSGALLLLLVSLTVAAAKGRQALLACLAITCACGFGCLDSGSHFSLPLLVVLVQAARRPASRAALLFVSVFSDPMVLLPLAILSLREARAPGPAAWLAILAAFVLNTLYSELSVSAVHVVLLVPAWTAGFWLARRLGLLGPACLGAGAVLVLAAWTGLVPARYGLPVTASIALLFFETRWRAPDIRAVLWPAAVVGLFLATADTARARRLTASFDCLSETLSARGIATVAADHWSAKPLALAAARAGRPLAITQVGFDDGRYHPWMAPHAAYGPATVWAVGNRDTCAVITSEARHRPARSSAPRS